VHQNRLLQMAREGARYSNQHLARFQPLKRHATIMAFLMHTYAFLIDHMLIRFRFILEMEQLPLPMVRIFGLSIKLDRLHKSIHIMVRIPKNKVLFSSIGSI
jgi:hypothetical protein